MFNSISFVKICKILVIMQTFSEPKTRGQLSHSEHALIRVIQTYVSHIKAHSHGRN